MTWHTDGPAARHARLRKHRNHDDSAQAVPVIVELYRTTPQPLTLDELRAVMADPDVTDLPDRAEVELRVTPMALGDLRRWLSDDRLGPMSPEATVELAGQLLAGLTIRRGDACG